MSNTNYDINVSRGDFSQASSSNHKTKSQNRMTSSSSSRKAATSSSGSLVPSSSSPQPPTPHLYAQQMNNSAAACIEIGLYDRAASSLKRALKLSKLQKPSRTGISDCSECTLDQCIVRSESTANSSISNLYLTELSMYTWRKPIKVYQQGNDTYHTMGPALYLIITFNLALTNHLLAFQSAAAALLDKGVVPAATKLATKARDLYKLTYEMQGKLLHHESRKEDSIISRKVTTSIKSIRFELILLNNLARVCQLLEQLGTTKHQYKSNKIDDSDDEIEEEELEQSEHEKYLQKLHSTLMIVVDHNVQRIGENDRTEHATAENNTNSSARRSGSSSNANHNMWKIDLDGFMRNTLHLILRPSYTSSAA